jgi:hypothetical protein
MNGYPATRVRVVRSRLIPSASLLLVALATATAVPTAAQAEVTPQMRAARIEIEATQGVVQSQLVVRPLAELGEVCNTSRAADVWKTGTLEVLYGVPSNTPMRIENWAGPYYYIAHAQGKPNGEIERSAINQSSCHNT